MNGLMSTTAVLAALAGLAMSGSAVAQKPSRDLSQGDAVPVCTMGPAEGCGVKWNLPTEANARIVVKQFNAAAKKLTTYRTFHERGKTYDSEALESGNLYVVESCAGSECTPSSTLWVPVLPLPHDVPKYVTATTPEGEEVTMQVSVVDMYGNPHHPELMLSQYNVYLMELILMQLDQSPEVYEQLPPMVVSFEGLPSVGNVAEHVEYNVVDAFNARRRLILR